MSGLVGDFAKLQNLIKSLKRLKGQGARRVTKQLSMEALLLVHESFRDETSPYGDRWKQSLRAMRDGGKTLQDTRRLHNSINARVTSATSFRLQTNVKYAAIHNFGGPIKRKERLQKRSRKGRFNRRGPYSSWISGGLSTMPKRQFIPDSGQMPRKWEQRMEEVAAATLMTVIFG